ncbi:tyrosine-type recombinase/integrase [Anaerobacillus sp. MEB173]|uniref:tyrosine-type recombinase/integrase n=1 Tax=Anaerobacillus sp. MEB173 TaxID=3383345 RepID=UPI003F8DBBCA
MDLFTKPDLELPDYANQYLAGLIEKGRLPSTIKRYTYDLEDFFRWLRSEKNCTSLGTWSKLTTEDLMRFLSLLEQEKHYAKRTIKRIVTVINQLYRYYEKKGIITINPMKGIANTSNEIASISAEDILSKEEQRRLLFSITSYEGLTENQCKARPLLIHRNLSIVHLFLYYGLTLQELVHLKMNHIHFETNTIDVPSLSSLSRTITLELDDKKLLYNYYESIPKAVRPRYHSHDPFFIAFDFQRNTYRWVYEIEQPKRFTEIAVQKMIRQEVKRAGLRKGISGQHLRNTFAIELLMKGESIETLQKMLGLKSSSTLQRYVTFLNQQQTVDKEKG